MSKYIIASEENMAYLAHYGVKGMKWRQRKAMQNTSGMMGAMKKGATAGENASIKAKEIERNEKAKEAIGALIKAGGKLVGKIHENNKKAAKTVGNAYKNFGETIAAPYKTFRVTDTIVSAGGKGGEVVAKQQLKKNKH